MHSLANILWDLMSPRDAQKGYPQMVVDYFRSFIKYLRIHRYPAIFNFKLLINPPGIILCDHHVRFGHKKHFSIREDKMPEE